MNSTFRDLMRAATRLTRSGSLTEATQAIQRALSGAKRSAHADPARPETPSHPEAHKDVKSSSKVDAATPQAESMVLDGCVFELATPMPTSTPADAAKAGFSHAPGVDSPAPESHEPWRSTPDAAPLATPTPTSQPPLAPAPSRADEFSSGTHTHASMTRAYKLYAPAGAAGKSLALVVMLHGCTQNPDDFAAGTSMNERAREQGFFVLYPEQSQAANPQRCWNWFKHNHQQRGGGEPAFIASLTQAVMRQHGIDSRRVYIAGLSAGGAMAAIVASAYPEIFAAVGVHSGLPSGAASNVAEALSAMKSGATGLGLRTRASRVGGNSSAVPTIVFHGDQDQTVNARNGEQVIADVLGSAAAEVAAASDISTAAHTPQVEHGVSAKGRRFTRSTHHAHTGKALAEHWLVHGAGHAWSGGHASGSYTDASGPDATREMLRFFFEHPHEPRH